MPLPAIASLLLVAFLAGACSIDRSLEAMDVLRDIIAGDGPSRLKRETAAPRRVEISYQVDGRARRGDLHFLPEPRAGVVLVPGVARGGKDDARLVAFARTLARARFAVLVPDIETLRELKVSPTDIREVADAVRHLSAQIGDVAGGVPRDVGLLAISYAAGPAVLATLEDDTRGKIRFVFAIGGYYDIGAVVTFFTTGNYRVGGEAKWRYRAPNEYGKWVFVKSNAVRLSDLNDRVALDEIAERKLADRNADIAGLVAGLGSEGRRVYALLANRDPDKVPELIAALPDALRDDLVGLDLKRRDLANPPSRLYLVHGRDDAIVPYTESEALAAAVHGGQARLFLLDSLAHVDVGPSGLLDAFDMLRAVYGLLTERDAMAPPRLPVAAP